MKSDPVTWQSVSDGAPDTDEALALLERVAEDMQAEIDRWKVYLARLQLRIDAIR